MGGYYYYYKVSSRWETLSILIEGDTEFRKEKKNKLSTDGSKINT